MPTHSEGFSPPRSLAATPASEPSASSTTSPVKEERPTMSEANLGERDKAIKILAKSIFRELKMNGYEARQIVALSSELLGLVTKTIKPGGGAGSDGEM